MLINFVKLSRLEVVNRLLRENKIDVHIRNNDENALLMMAARYGHLEVVDSRRLLQDKESTSYSEQ